jgi:hypothetical protein
MKMKALLSIAVFFLAAQLVFPGEAFEGSYDMNFRGKDMNITTTFWVKGGHVKMKHQGTMAQMGEMIIRDDMSTIIVCVPQQMAYLEMPIPSEGDFTLPDPDPEGELPFKKTGETKEILGFKAHEFIYEANNEKLVIWATDELGSMPFARNQIFTAWAAAMRRVSGLPNFFPLETLSYAGDKVNVSMKVTKVEKQKLPDSLFRPPEGYRKMTLPAGMGGFMGK